MADSTGHLVPPKSPPSLNIPHSNSTVKISCIDSTSYLNLPMNALLKHDIKGKDRLTCPAFSFLIEHAASDTRLLFDLGVRKEPMDLPPTMAGMIRDRGWTVTVEVDVATTLTQNGVNVSEGAIDHVIWSHHHFDHIGDMSTFPKTTGLIVGPGFLKEHLPGYPENKKSILWASDFEDRPVREVDIQSEGKGLRLGRFHAYDFFGDGSFYLLDTPGHSIGHICGLARTTGGDDSTFMLLGGDACHHGGEFRPTEYLPLPKEVKPFTKPGMAVCPGELLQRVQRNKSATEPYYEAADGVPSSDEDCQSTIAGLGEFDCQDNVLVLIAHDDTVMDDLVLYPKGMMNDWRSRETARKVKWKFLCDFQQAV